MKIQVIQTLHSRRGRTGFTIVEVLVVILLISLLAVFVAPQYLNRIEGAKRKTATAQIAKLELHLGAFSMDCGRLPSSTEGLAALRTCPPDLTDKWKGPYCKESHLLDPWGNPYKYIKPGTKNPNSYDIVSYGVDGQLGGDGDNADIFND